MRLTFLGASETVTGSKYLIEHQQRKFLVDCGLFQGLKELRLKNWDSLTIDPDSIDSVLLTHAHIDHSGYLPKLVKDGFNGNIYANQETIDLCRILLTDSAKVMEEDAEYANLTGFSKHSPALPLFTVKDVQTTMGLFKPVKRFTKIDLGKGLHASYMPAGHILGANIIRLNDTSKNIKIGFSGDLGRLNDPIMVAPEHFHDIDYLVMESTYGDRLHDSTDPLVELEITINQTIERNGVVIIPSFAVGRTQSILYYLWQLKSQKRIADIPIYLNSPMGANVSDLYIRYHEDHKLNAKDCKNYFDVAKYIRTGEESIALNKKKPPFIIIAGSGMATGGRVLHHLKRYLPDERATILFVGYQAPGTRGADIVAGKKQIKMHGQMINVNAQVKLIDSLSAHADSAELIKWLRDSGLHPKTVFITHGEPEAASALKNKIESEFHWQCEVPKLNANYDL